jgi:hypothetical protein
MRRLAEESGLRYELAAIHQSLAILQQHVGSLRAPLDFPYVFSLTQMVNETAATSQAVQKLLVLHYQDMARRNLPLPDLQSTEFRCFSQNGEDGLLLFTFALIGTTNQMALEICAGDGTECNTANLVINHGWHGFMFDGSEERIQRGREFFGQRCQDTFIRPPELVAAWITAENVNDLVSKAGVCGEIDLLSLDIDGMDYWVWKSLMAVSPRVVVLEFNLTWGPNLSVSVPYNPAFKIDYDKQPHYSGASLAAFAKLGKQKGYRLVGIERLGFNAIFLRSDVGTDYFPELSPVECFTRDPILRGWHSNWIPDPADRPEWAEFVEV